MKFAEFKENINSIYGGKFDNSTCVVRPYKDFGKFIYIGCLFAENSAEASRGSSENDKLKISFCIDLPDSFDFDKDELPENLTMVADTCLIKSDNECIGCNTREIPYRKSKGTAENLISVFGKFIDDFCAQLVEDLNSGNIYKNYNLFVERKI